MAIANQGPFFSGGTPENSVDTTPYAPGLLGAEVQINVGTTTLPLYRKYKYVKASGTCSPFNVVEYTAAGINNTVQTGTATLGPPTFFAGVVASTVAVTTGQFFWIVVPMIGSTFFATHNVASNATQSGTGLFWALSAGSFGTMATTFSSNQSLNVAMAINLSSINSTSATSVTSTNSTVLFLWSPVI